MPLSPQPSSLPSVVPCRFRVLLKIMRFSCVVCCETWFMSFFAKSVVILGYLCPELVVPEVWGLGFSGLWYVDFQPRSGAERVIGVSGCRFSGSELNCSWRSSRCRPNIFPLPPSSRLRRSSTGLTCWSPCPSSMPYIWLHYSKLVLVLERGFWLLFFWFCMVVVYKNCESAMHLGVAQNAKLAQQTNGYGLIVVVAHDCFCSRLEWSIVSVLQLKVLNFGKKPSVLA